MMPYTFGTEVFETPAHEPSSPELRRMDMFNRARREELDTILYNINPRHSVTVVSNQRKASDSPAFARLINGLRQGIGNVLITAGNRIQNPA